MSHGEPGTFGNQSSLPTPYTDTVQHPSEGGPSTSFNQSSVPSADSHAAQHPSQAGPSALAKQSSMPQFPTATRGFAGFGRFRFQSGHSRGYKACNQCRARRQKCIPGENRATPCARCQREMKECTYPAERAIRVAPRPPGTPSTRSISPQKRRRMDSPQQTGEPSYTSDNENHAQPDYTFNLTEMEKRSENRPEGLTHAVENSGATSARLAEYIRQPYDSPERREETQAMPTPDLTSGSSGRHGETKDKPKSDLTDAVIRTVVSSGNDALRILFEAATQEGEISVEDSAEGTSARNPALDHSREVIDIEPHGVSDNSPPESTWPVASSAEKSEVLRLWNNFKFVRMGWFSAEEAVNYIDLFFKNMWPLSPILTDAFSFHDTHVQLLTNEPFLCCTLLMISSRYHSLPGANGASRSFCIHDQLWEHCQQLIARIMFGQEKGSHLRTRTVGSIEALLLISEWHPRALHFPSKSDGWDIDLLASDREQTLGKHADPGQKWLEDVIEPARRSDRMSWMLLGCAISLGHELDVFRDEETAPAVQLPRDISRSRQIRVRKLLYVYTNQLATRLGCTSIYPQSVVSFLLKNSVQTDSVRWDYFMNAWSSLTALLKSWSDLVFPSPAVTKQLLHGGRYVSILEHYKPLLHDWHEKHLYSRESINSTDIFQTMLFIEYQYLRIYCNSLGMQAVCEHALVDPDFNTSCAISVDSIDQGCIQEVIEAGCSILEELILLAEAGTLRYAPVRIFLRVTTASIFLLKAISLGVKNGQLPSTFEILERSIEAIRSSSLDEMHLALSYATLLETHVKRIRRGFQRSSRRIISNMSMIQQLRDQNTDRMQNGSGDAEPSFTNDAAEQNFINSDAACVMENAPVGTTNDETSVFLQNFLADDWLSLPFDPSMAPFNTDATQSNPPTLDDGSLGFVWNIPQ